MTTASDAVMSAIDDNWNVGTGGTKPALYNKENIGQDWPPDNDWVMAKNWEYEKRRKRRNDSFVKEDDYVGLRVHSKNDANLEERLDEIVTEIYRIVTPTNVSGYHKVDIIGQTRRASDKRTKRYVADLTVELKILSTSSTATPGSVATSTIEVDNLVVNTAITGTPTAALGVVTVTDITASGAVYSSSAFVGGGRSGFAGLFAVSAAEGAYVLCYGETHASKPGQIVYTTSTDDGADGKNVFRVYDSGGTTDIAELDSSGNFQIDGDLTVSGGDIIAPAALNLKISGDNDDYLEWSTVAGVPKIKIISGRALHIDSDHATDVWLQVQTDTSNYMRMQWEKDTLKGKLQSTGPILMVADGDTNDYWYFSTAGDIASFLPVEDKIHLIGSAVLSADNVYSDDFTNTSPFKKFDDPLESLKQIKEKGDKIDYTSIPEWVRTVGRDPTKQQYEKQMVIDEETGKLVEKDVVIQRAPKDVILDNAWSVNRMVVLLYQALQEATARIEALEAAR